jgi:hypothetical protein
MRGHTRRVLNRRSKEEVDVTGDTRMPVERDGMSTDDEKLNYVRVQ